MSYKSAPSAPEVQWSAAYFDEKRARNAAEDRLRNTHNAIALVVVVALAIAALRVAFAFIEVQSHAAQCPTEGEPVSDAMTLLRGEHDDAPLDPQVSEPAPAAP